jgi:hypothetical protein
MKHRLLLVDESSDRSRWASTLRAATPSSPRVLTFTVRTCKQPSYSYVCGPLPRPLGAHSTQCPLKRGRSASKQGRRPTQNSLRGNTEIRFSNWEQKSKGPSAPGLRGGPPSLTLVSRRRDTEARGQEDPLNLRCLR